jgi:predicted NBD/HSP70 family sugar kinase
LPHETALPVHIPEQIALYAGDDLLTQEVCPFDPGRAMRVLDDERDVLAIDIGGDKLRHAIYALGDGDLRRREEAVFRSRHGVGYLAVLERLAGEAERRDLRVGVSSATKLDGSVITRTVNLPTFFAELADRYGADYGQVFGERAFVANDTIAGICGASTRLGLGGVAVRDVAFVICASGMGAAVLHAGVAIHVEAGHVPIAEGLNPLGQTTACGVEGRPYVCVERVAAARAGIEDLYRRLTGEARDGMALGRMYEDGDELATALYEGSARALAHAAAGVMRRYGFAPSRQAAVVFHGGNFEIARYRREVGRQLDAIPGVQPRIVFSRDLSPNVCLDGAAILAAYGVDATTR